VGSAASSLRRTGSSRSPRRTSPARPAQSPAAASAWAPSVPAPRNRKSSPGGVRSFRHSEERAASARKTAEPDIAGGRILRETRSVREGVSMRSARYLVAFLASFAILLAACQSPNTGGGGTSPTAAANKPTYGGTVTFALENDVSNLDPMLSGLFVDRNIHYAMYDSLVRVDVKGSIIPWLAEKWTTSSDGKTVTFNLRQ